MVLVQNIVFLRKINRLINPAKNKYLVEQVRNGILFLWFSFLIFQVQAQSAFQVIQKDLWHNSSITQNIAENYYSDVHGFIYNGKEFAALCTTDGTVILEISNEDQLIYRGEVPGRIISNQVVNRDAFFYNGYVYAICDQGMSSLQIIDLSYMPDSLHVVYDSDSLVQRAHSIFIDTASARMYICGPNSNLTGEDALSVYDLSNSQQPQLMSHFNMVQYVHDAYVRNDTAWLNCGPSGVVVVNFANPSVPIIIGDLSSYPYSGYNHSGWLSENGKQYVFTDETPGRPVKYCDVSDLSDIQVVANFKSFGNTNTTAHNPILMGDYVYLSYYYDGLQIFDVSHPSDPVLSGWYDTYFATENDFSGAWGIHVFPGGKKILISDQRNGLFLLEFSPPPRIETSAEFGVYPNPAQESAWFYLANPRMFSFDIQIYNMQGKHVAQTEIPGNSLVEFSTLGLSSGMYFYEIIGRDVTLTYRGKFEVIH
jgi:choice-of-anchor B domain-containing protein